MLEVATHGALALEIMSRHGFINWFDVVAPARLSDFGLNVLGLDLCQFLLCLASHNIIIIAL